MLEQEITELKKQILSDIKQGNPVKVRLGVIKLKELCKKRDSQWK